MKKETKSNHFPYFFLFTYITVLFLFKNAFSVPFILDDFFFLTLGHAKNALEFINFFSPFKGFFYRPLTTEVFYFFINVFHQNLLFAHSLVFLFYFIGLYFLYKTSLLLTKNKNLALFFVFLYAIHFTHVFQLYMLNTFQEIALFAFLTISAYYFLVKNYSISVIFFLCGLLSKEIAIVYPAFLFVIIGYQTKLKDIKKFQTLGIYFLLSIIFFFIYKNGASHVSEIAIYTVHFSPKLIINNIQWYFLWALGLPNFYPNYTKSIVSLPTPDFWNLFNYQDYKIYFYSLAAFYSIFSAALVYYFVKCPEKIKAKVILLSLSLLSFLIFISPTLPIIHRWMVRLTVPLVFIVSIEAYFIYLFYTSGKVLRVFSAVLFVLYMTFNYMGTTIHESSSLIFLEADISHTAARVMSKDKEVILKKKIIYFADTKDSPLGGSKKLKLSLGNEYFLHYFFPEKNIRAIYGFENPKIPKDAFIIPSDDLIFKK